jgi:hypothetical protein
MSDYSVYNFTTLINEQEKLITNIAQIKSLINLLLNTNLLGYFAADLHLNLGVIDDLLTEVELQSIKCDTFLRRLSYSELYGKIYSKNVP